MIWDYCFPETILQSFDTVDAISWRYRDGRSMQRASLLTWSLLLIASALGSETDGGPAQLSTFCAKAAQLPFCICPSRG